MVLGDVTGSVQGDKTGRIHSKSISKSFFTTVEEVGLYFIPSNSTEIPAGTDDVASSHTWSDVSSGSGFFGLREDHWHSLFPHDELWLRVWVGLRLVLRWGGGDVWHTLFFFTLEDGEGGTIVEEYPLHVLLKST